MHPLSLAAPGELPTLEGVAHRTAEARGVRFHLAEAGAGPPVLLLHGWPQHWWAWRRVVPLLAPHARLIMLDLRGFGWSDAPPRGYGKEGMAEDVLAVLDALGLERVRMIGHDWGAWIAFLACCAAPERVERLLALGIVPPVGRPRPRALAGVWRLAYQLVLAAPVLGERVVASRRFVPWLLTAGAADAGAFSRDDLHAFAAVLAEPARARASARLYRTFVTREAWRARGRRLRVPTLLMLGARDPVVRPAMVAGRERWAADLTVEVIPGCGHFVPEERPELVAERARSFLRLG
ncbi:MAG TPA: alpha/beta hydrolase [Solirubrobacteraceae bacterium]